MPLSPSETRALLDRLGHRPRRQLGQNFLVDGNIVRKSLELARVAEGDRIVEIGPGLGTLTGALLEAGAHVWAIEMDRTLHAYLESTLVQRHRGRVHLEEGDAVVRPTAGLPTEAAAAGFKIVANLPYAISTPWMDAVLSGPLPERLVLMLQEESARRFAASPGSKSFGPITLFLASAYEVAPGHRVSADCFYPKPEVGSFLMHLVRRPEPFVFPPGVKALVRGCFQQRRKQIGAILRTLDAADGLGCMAALAAAGVDPRTRPEDIPVAAWQSLAESAS